ncbi:MAG: helix-turn-helix domain-containing protein, partial [Bacteroidetes bacterium]
MNPFSEQLRSGREARGITLADIARTTRINIKYLEALEQGAFDVLPQTYIRAFIRSYAEAIGTPPERLLHQYDLIVTERYTGASGAPPA